VEALFLLARERSELRRLDGPVGRFLDQKAQLCRQQTRDGGPQAQALVMALMDLACHHPGALLAIAEFRARAGDGVNARRTARWGCRLAPHDAELAARRAAVEACSQRTVVLVPPVRRPATVLLVPPLGPVRPEVRLAIDATAAALDAAGVAYRIAAKAVPEAEGIEVVHAFDLGEASTWLGRLQVVRAMRPDCRILFSPLLTDPARANWLGQVVGGRLHLPADELRAVYGHAAAGRVRLEGRAGRELPSACDPIAMLYEQRCLQFVDGLLHATPGASRWLSERHPQLPPQTLLADALLPGRDAPAVTDDVEVPIGQVLLLGPRDLQCNHHAAVLALADSGLAVTSFGVPGFPYDDGRTQALGGARLRLCAEASPATRTAALRRSAVFVWLPSEPVSFALPELAHACGAELVLARDPDIERQFGDRATYVDPCDLPALRAAVLAARERWRGPHAGAAPPATAVAAFTRFKSGLLHAYGLDAVEVEPEFAAAVPSFT
jgi:hypothetical protein